MKKLKAFKVLKISATGNKFALVDLRKMRAPLPLPDLARKLSLELATDGMVAIRTDIKDGVKMDFFNPDGSEAFCGNGTRSTGFYMTHYARKKKKGAVNVLTIDGMRRVEVDGEWAKLTAVPEPKIFDATRVDAGCPHVVLFVEDVEPVDVEKEGRTIRYHKDFQPAGTNVDFVQVAGPGRLKIRTYERGVERETGSCGSGALASAALARKMGKIKGDRCDLDTRGGKLRVYFGANGKKDLALEGTVDVLFEGVFYA